MSDLTISKLTMSEAAAKVLSQNGESLAELSYEKPLLVTFLRHAGCTFCREALSDLSRDRQQIEALGVSLAFVHMSSEAKADKMFAAYQLGDCPRFSDPDQHLYRAFQLGIGNVRQLVGLDVLLRGFYAAIIQRHGFSWLQGNGLRMPGVFLVKQGEIVAAYRHQTAADRPDYTSLARKLHSAE